ncbi:MAG: hypothetical protein ACTSPY_12160 [Candidatus Helarchaeota archaeon]
MLDLPVSLDYLIFDMGYIIYSIVCIICSIKITLVYKKHKNFVSILLSIWFIVGFFFGIYGMINVLFPKVYIYEFNTVALLYLVVLSTILFYILNIKEGYFVPLTIFGVLLFQINYNLDLYLLNLHIFQVITVIILAVGYVYLTIKKKDGKSLSFVICLVLSAIVIPISQINLYVSGIFMVVISIFLLLGMFGIFDKLLKSSKTHAMTENVNVNEGIISGE